MVVGIPFHGGMLFPTTMGVSSSGDSSYAVRVTFNIFNQLRQWEIHLKENEEAYKKEIINTMSMRIDKELDYKLIIEEGYFVAYEIHTQAKIKLFKTM